MAHGHANLHPGPLDVIEVEMMEDSEADGGQGNARSIDVGLIDCSCVGGVVTLKVLDYLPE